MRSQIQAAEMSIHCRVAGLSFKDRVRSSDIWRELGVVPLLLERRQLRWFVHLIRMPPEHLPLEVFCALRPISHLACERLRIPQEELETVAGEKNILNTLLSLLPL